jgi:hypothetical protein
MLLNNNRYLKTADVNTGDVITFKSEGEWVKNTKFTYEDGTPKTDFVIKVDFGGEERTLRLSKMNRDVLITAFGQDTVDWIEKQARISKVKAAVGGKMVDMLVLEAI